MNDRNANTSSGDPHYITQHYHPTRRMTAYVAGQIERERDVDHEWTDSRISGLLSNEDGVIRDSLIRLGWTPLPQDNVEEDLVCVNCGRKYTIDESGRPVCSRGCGHPDGNMSYMCRSAYCRCKS